MGVAFGFEPGPLGQVWRGCPLLLPPHNLSSSTNQQSAVGWASDARNPMLQPGGRQPRHRGFCL